MELPEYTVTPCANQGITLTMSARAAELVERNLDFQLEWPANDNVRLLREIAMALQSWRLRE